MNTNEIDNSDIIISIYERLYQCKEDTSIGISYKAFYRSLTIDEMISLSGTPRSQICPCETATNSRIIARNMFWQMLREYNKLAYLTDEDIVELTKRFKSSYDEDETNEVNAFIKEVNEERAKCQITSE